MVEDLVAADPGDDVIGTRCVGDVRGAGPHVPDPVDAWLVGHPHIGFVGGEGVLGRGRNRCVGRVAGTRPR